MAAEAESRSGGFQPDQNQYNRRNLARSEERDVLDICLHNGWRPGNSEVWRLVRLRDRVKSGVVSDLYPVDKKQGFIRWLVGQGKLSDE